MRRFHILNLWKGGNLGRRGADTQPWTSVDRDDDDADDDSDDEGDGDDVSCTLTLAPLL